MPKILNDKSTWYSFGSSIYINQDITTINRKYFYFIKEKEAQEALNLLNTYKRLVYEHMIDRFK